MQYIEDIANSTFFALKKVADIQITKKYKIA